jgi:uncharacterized RDD family membrane protein YckC
MAAGIRVIETDDAPVRFGAAVVRALAYLVSVAPAGVGFLACFVGSDRRAVHDRLAGTRVVRSS